MNKKILVVEDEVRIARVLSLELTHEGYEVQTVENGRDALTLANNEQWDLILLDIMLPEMSGFEVLRRIRLFNQKTPIILLTARNSMFDKVNGLDHGANDYITKPFAMEELLARVRSAIRITESIQPPKEIKAKKRYMNDLELDESARMETLPTKLRANA